MLISRRDGGPDYSFCVRGPIDPVYTPHLALKYQLWDPTITFSTEAIIIHSYTTPYTCKVVVRLIYALGFSMKTLAVSIIIGKVCMFPFEPSPRENYVCFFV